MGRTACLPLPPSGPRQPRIYISRQPVTRQTKRPFTFVSIINRLPARRAASVAGFICQLVGRSGRVHHSTTAVERLNDVRRTTHYSPA